MSQKNDPADPRLKDMNLPVDARLQIAHDILIEDVFKKIVSAGTDGFESARVISNIIIDSYHSTLKSISSVPETLMKTLDTSKCLKPQFHSTTWMSTST